MDKLMDQSEKNGVRQGKVGNYNIEVAKMDNTLIDWNFWGGCCFLHLFLLTFLFFLLKSCIRGFFTLLTGENNFKIKNK